MQNQENKKIEAFALNVPVEDALVGVEDVLQRIRDLKKQLSGAKSAGDVSPPKSGNFSPHTVPHDQAKRLLRQVVAAIGQSGELVSLRGRERLRIELAARWIRLRGEEPVVSVVGHHGLVEALTIGHERAPMQAAPVEHRHRVVHANDYQVHALHQRVPRVSVGKLAPLRYGRGFVSGVVRCG